MRPSVSPRSALHASLPLDSGQKSGGVAAAPAAGFRKAWSLAQRGGRVAEKRGVASCHATQSLLTLKLGRPEQECDEGRSDVGDANTATHGAR